MPDLLDPSEAIERLIGAVDAVATRELDLAEAAGRVLAEPAMADRDQPPCDTSAMDGYAVRVGDSGTLPVAAESWPGLAPPSMPVGSVVRIFTGAPVPTEAEAVVKREETDEHGERVTLSQPITAGQHIRRRGENVKAGSLAMPAGHPITGVSAATLASFGVRRPVVYRRVRVAVLVTGDELVDDPSPHQIRDSNGPALAAMLGRAAWLDVLPIVHVLDDLTALTGAIAEALEQADAVLLTGGVSMGDRDHTPAAVEANGGRTLYHKLRMRPGKPNLGAVTSAGQLVLGLPGNPMSVLVGARLLAAPGLRRLAGFAEPREKAAHVEVQGDDATLRMWWYRPCRLDAAGLAVPTRSLGSGDPVGPAASDGFLEQPPGDLASGTRRFFPWTL